MGLQVVRLAKTEIIAKLKINSLIGAVAGKATLIVGTTMLIAGFSTSVASATAASQGVTPLTAFNYNSVSYSGQCIQDNGLGAQATLTSNRANCAVFPTPRIGYVANCLSSDMGSASCYQYQDRAGYCLKYDPNISGHPVVFYTCATSGVTKQEEEFTDPDGSSEVVNQYAFNNLDSYVTLQGHSNGGVDLSNNPQASGLKWSI